MPSDSGAPSPQERPWNSSSSRKAPEPQCPARRCGYGISTRPGETFTPAAYPALARHLRGDHGNAEAVPGLVDDGVLEVGLLADGVAEDHDLVGRKRGQGVLQGEQRIALAR